MSARVAVIGGGLAGITAALRCADAGAAVTLLEATPRLGGLTHSFRRGQLQVDNGQHVFLRCCSSYLRLLDRLGVADQVCLQPRLDVAVHSPHSTARLHRSNLPAPMHLAASLARYRLLTPCERARAVQGALALRAVDPADPATDAHSFGEWLQAAGQSPRIVAALWDVIGVATLNARAADASLALAATVMQQGLLTDRAAGDIGWPLVPLQQLHGDAARACLDATGCRVCTNAKVRSLHRHGGDWVIGVAGGAELTVDMAVLAVPPPAAAALAPPGSIVAPQGWAAGLGSSPIVNVHIVFDRKVLDEPFLAAVHSPVQWVFDRTASSGLTTGQYLAVSLSAAHDLIDLTTDQVRQRILPALTVLLPAAADAQVRDFFVTRQRHATFNPTPGTAALRPPTATAAPGLVLAGAYTATGWPATMEGAVRSGDAAADVLLRVPTPDAAEGARVA